MPNYQDAASWLFARANRPDENMRQLLEMLMMSKQLEEQRGQQKWERGIKEREVSAEEMWRQAQLAGAMQERQPSALEQEINALIQAGYDPKKAIEGAVFGREPKPEKEPKPTTFEKKEEYVKKQIASGAMTKEQGDEILYNIPKKPTPEEIRAKGASPRQSNATWLRDVYKNVDPKDVKNPKRLIKGIPNTRPMIHGVYLDMPYEYNIALLNINDGVATEKDTDIVERYNAMFRIFQEDFLAKRIPWKQFITSALAKDPLIDNAQFKVWYDTYFK